MKRNPSLSLAILATSILAFAAAAQFGRTTVSSAQQRTTLRYYEDFDIRGGHERTLAVPPTTPRPSRAEMSNAREQFQQAHPQASLWWSSLTNTPSRVWAQAGALTERSNDQAETIARRFLQQGIFQLDSAEANALQLTQQDQTTHNGVTHITLQQQVNGIEVFGGRMSVHLNRAGEVFAASGELIPQAARTINIRRPRLAANTSLERAANSVGIQLKALPASRFTTDAAQQQTFARTAELAREANAQLVYFPLAADKLQLAWELEIWPAESPNAYLMIIDAERGSLLYRHNLTCYESDPHGLVFTGNSPRPDNPHVNNNPPLVERQDVAFRPAPFNGSVIFVANDPHFDWWAGKPALELSGNNVDAHLDRNNDDLPDLPTLKTTDGNFSFPLDLTKAPTTADNQKAAQTNLFYWTNRFHDILYSFGFTESAGNFQTDNFGLGGQDNDAVQADAQDGSGVNNANFTTPPDGCAGRVQMFLWSGSPQLDGSVDQTIILHELTHGVSNRLIGNGLGLSGIHARGLGEGWSDYLALALLGKESDPIDGQYLIAQYATGQYERGLRFFPYSTDLTVSPMTFSRIFTNPLPHPVGEIWGATLWDLRALLLKKYGFREGQRQGIQLVIDGMKLTPVEPTFIEARDAILLADRVNNNGANQCLLWQAFAKRGLGYGASAIQVNDRRPVESFDAPPFCSDRGTVKLDKPNYVSGETMQISLWDRNAKAPVTVQITSSVTGDQEAVQLTSDAGLSGSYRGMLKTSPTRKQANDGVLQASVEVGDKILVTYNDPDTDNNSTAIATTQAAMVREKLIFEDTVEAGNQGWIATGTWAITTAASASHAWTDSPAGNYTNLSDSSLTSPSFDLTNYSDVTLLFAHRYDLENRYDYGYIEYSLDDGSTWNYATSFTGTQLNFTQVQVNLNTVSGQKQLRFRFRLLSDLELNADGWFIDDIRLLARTTDATVIQPGSTPAPVIASISPAFGPLQGGTAITLTGANFTETSDTSVTIDGIAASNINVISSNTITAKTPPHVAGTVAVRIFNRNGGSSLNQGFTYWAGEAATKAPTVNRLAPVSGSTKGGTVVTLYGIDFTPATTVMVGVQTGTVTFVNPNELRITTPAAAAGAVAIKVANGNLIAAQAPTFTYLATTPPRVQVLSPSSDETLYVGSNIVLRWASSDDHAVAKHRLALVHSDGSIATEITNDISGAQQSLVWEVPPVLASGLRLRVTAIDDEGNETHAESAASFQIARRWEAAISLPEVRWQSALVGDGRSLFALGGLTGSAGTTVNRLVRFDPGNNIWTTLAPMPRAVSSTAATFLNGKIYVPGGTLSSGLVISNQQVYDVANNRWAEVLEAPSSSNFFALATDATQGVYYRVSGSAVGITRPISDMLAYDVQANAWTQLSDMPEPRYGHEAAFIAGQVFVAGGADRSGGKRNCWRYDPITDTWSQIASLNKARRFAISAVGSDAAGNPLWFIFGGDDPNTSLPLSDGEVYDLRNNRWLPLDNSFNLSAGRTQLASAVLNGKLYAAGGAILSDDGKAYVISNQLEALPIHAITPVSPNQPPVLAAPASAVAIVGTETQFEVIANDLASGTALNLKAEGLPANATFTINTEANNNTRGLFYWTPKPEDAGRSWTLMFTASDGQFVDRRTVTLRVVAAESLAVVNAASYFGGAVAADSIAAGFGANLAPRTEQAQATPLPLAMAGTSVTVNGLPAPLLYVSPEQINFVIPSDVKPGIATVIVSNSLGKFSLGHITITASAPAIFTADASGRGEAAAVSTVDGIRYQRAPFRLAVDGKPNYLLLFGTGLRRATTANANDDNGIAESVSATIGGFPAKVLYAGAQGEFIGLDQLNLELPTGLATELTTVPSLIEVVISVDGVEANRTSIWLKKE